MRRLLVYQAIWGMENLAGVDLEADMAGALDRIFAAGFDGVGVSLMRPDRAEAVARGVAARGASFEAIGFVRERADLAGMIDRAEALGAHHLNVQVMTRVDRVSQAVALFREFEAEAERARIPVYYETHRGRLTNDLLFMVRVLDELPGLRLTGDLSHYPLVCEMPLPVPEPDLQRMTRIIDQSWAFHGRVSGSHQVQVSVVAPQHQGWVEQYRAWWRQGFRSWLARAGAEDELTFMPELGPPHYAITDQRGVELADRWQEAVILKDMARELFSEASALAGSTDAKIVESTGNA